MSLPRSVTLTAGAVTSVDLTGDVRDGATLEVRVGGSQSMVWVRGDGGTPAAFGARSRVNWWNPADPESGSRVYVDLGSADRTLRLLCGDAVPVQINRARPTLDLTKVNRGFGVGALDEYPQVGSGVTAIVLSEPRRPGGTVRVDFPNEADFSVTADGTTPSLTNGATTVFGERSHLVYLPETAPEQALKVYAEGPTTWPVRIRVQTVLSSAIPN